MKNPISNTRTTPLFILAIWVNFNITTIHAQQRWEVTQIRGEIRANGDPNPLKKGALIYDTTPLSFSKTSDIMAVINRKDHTPKIIQPEGFTFDLNAEKPCGHCKAVWTEPTIAVSTSHVKMVEIDGVLQKKEYTVNSTKQASIDEFWTQVTEPIQVKVESAGKATSKPNSSSNKDFAAQQRWEVTQIRGEIHANSDPNPLKKGAFIYRTTPLAFSRTSDIMLVVNTKVRVAPQKIQAINFTNSLKDAQACGQCPLSWTEIPVIVSWNIEHGDNNTAATTSNEPQIDITKSIDAFWGDIEPPLNPVLGITNIYANYVVKMELSPGSTLQPDASIYSPNNKFKLIYQPDGNLVLYRLSDNFPLWSTGTAGQPAGRCDMQADGNLVIYKPDGQAIWSSGTWGDPYAGSKLVLQDNGNLRITQAKSIWWESRTFEGTANSNTAGIKYEISIFQPRPKPDKQYKIISAVGSKTLDVPGYNKAPGTLLQIWDPHGDTNQRWTISSGKTGLYTIQSALGLMLDVQWGSPNGGTPVHMWDKNGAPAQDWDLIPAGDGWFYLRNALGMYLDVQNGVDVNGTGVWVYWFNGSNAQKWRFEE